MESKIESEEENSWGNVLKVSDDKEPIKHGKEESIEIEKYRKRVEPWLTALFQNEHLNLLVGNGLTTAICQLASSCSGANMDAVNFSTHANVLNIATETIAKKTGRKTPNIEDQIRTANKLIDGLEILELDGVGHLSKELKKELNEVLKKLITQVLGTERLILKNHNPRKGLEGAAKYLMSFLLSFASRTASRDRLHIFTTNYDRLIEWATDMAGIHLMDRFVGTLSPIFRSSRLELDMHYNPPGIRGEPRYLEGLARFTKLHGSLDWSYQGRHVRRVALPFGADSFNPYLERVESCLIYPNSAKDRETAEFPYVELFRDLAAALCRPNTVLVCYGYGFGDEHINRVIEDMLSIPSTHLVIISYDNAAGRISGFYEKVGRSDQVSLLIGHIFADLSNLVDYFLPRPAIDLTTKKVQEIIDSRGWNKRDDKAYEETDLDFEV